MEYLQSIGTQTAVFLRTVGFAFLLGAVYDLLRFVRMLTRSRRIVVWDVGFGAFAGVAAFLFALTQNGGKVRVHLLAAMGVGFCVWYFFAAGPVRAAADGVLRAVRRASSAVRRPVAYLALWVSERRNKLWLSLKKTVKKLQKNEKNS